MPVTTITRFIQAPVKEKSPFVWVTSGVRDPGAYCNYFKPGYYNNDPDKPNYFKIKRALINLYTSAAVADRNLYWAVTGVTGGYAFNYFAIKGPDTPANSGGDLALIPSFDNPGSLSLVTSTDGILGIKDLIISGDDYIACGAINPQAGDLYYAYVMFEYLNWSWDNR